MKFIDFMLKLAECFLKSLFLDFYHKDCVGCFTISILLLNVCIYVFHGNAVKDL